MTDATELGLLCARLELDLASAGSLEERVAVSVGAISSAFAVDPDEVALFLLDERRTVLHFLWPERLKPVGFIPFSSIDSLAARTAREARVFITNTFASQHHASFFEKIRLQEGFGERPKPIQKIMSVPMLAGDEVRGVIQVSRKGSARDPDLPNFSDADAAGLVDLAQKIATAL
jgi:GAF domain-containing protein